MRNRLVEILYFDGCPNHEAARASVERLIDELGIDVELKLVNVPDPETAERERFLGSPTVRVDGVDVEPGAMGRTDFVLACRVYQPENETTGTPDEQWIHAALLEKGDG